MPRSLPLLAAAALVLAGCGNDESSGPTTTRREPTRTSSVITLVAFEVSAADGRPTNVVRIPLRLH